MRAITLSLGAVAILLISSTPCLGQDSDGFHSYANLSDTDKIGLVIQRLNRAIESKDADGVVKCLSVALRSDASHADSVKTRFETLFQRMDAVLNAIGGKGAGGDKSEIDPVFHLSQPKPARIDPDTAALAQPFYLGSNPAHYSDTVQLCLSSWFGMYGITNALDLAANMENVLNEAIENPELLAAEAAVARSVTKSMRTSTDLPNMLRHKRFHPGHELPAEVFNKEYANAEFEGKDLFGRPYDLIDVTLRTLHVMLPI